MKIVNIKKLKKELNKLNDFVSVSAVIKAVHSATTEYETITNKVINDTEYWKSGNKHYKTVNGKTTVISKKEFLANAVLEGDKK